MKTQDLIEETYTAVTANKARSGLTILGIVIGIGSVIGMISIGQGAQSSIETSIQSIGSDLITISSGQARSIGSTINSGSGSAQTLTVEDASAIRTTISNVKAVAEQSSSRYQVAVKGANTNTQVIGTVDSYFAIRNLVIDQGNFFSSEQTKNASKVAVLGPTTKTTLFGENGSAIGQKIKINSTEFTIIGVTKSKGGSGFANQDDIIFVPLKTFQRFLTGTVNVSSINVQASGATVMSQVQQDITTLLLSRHNIKNPTAADFTVVNQADIVSAASSVTSVFTYLLAAIASISLLVGGIGIMNMMLTTVTERTREIGLRKAIGGKKSDISTQFLFESMLLTFIGGTAGIVLGWLISIVVSKFANITTKISPMSILLAFGVSAAIGLIFGYYPARRAAKLNPIEALRYE
jgi:putative ABC transport system permease protein